MDRNRAEQALVDWGITYRDRDARILQGVLAGMNKNRIHQATGLSRNTVEAVLAEYPVVDTAAVLRAKVRALGEFTAPELDYSLAVGDGRAMSALNNVAYVLANEGHPEVQPGEGDRVLAERRRRADELWERVLPEVEAMAARAKARKYTGWSTAAKARGQKIAYTD